jgi:hypothetical protein
MTSREPARLANAISRLWLLAAALALLLPASTRLGYWLPLHLALAGAVSVAISGNMATFAWTLTATPSGDPWIARTQLSLITAGAALIAAGYPKARTALVAIGGACFVGAAVLLLLILWSAWRRSLNRRHGFPMVMYALAVGSVIAGGTIGAVLGTGAAAASRFDRLRDAHMALNVLGWASLTIIATLTTLLPTVLRLRMPRWNQWRAGILLTVGLAALVAGLGTGARSIAALGALAYWIGGLQVAALVVRGVSAPRNWPAPAAARHMILGFVWFVAGGAALTWATVTGSFDAFIPSFEVMFVCGWLIQTLLGSWSHLLPTMRSGSPDDRRRWFTAMDLGIGPQVLALNGGLVLLALAAGHLVGDAVGWAGAGMALAAGGVALAKTWAYPAIAAMPIVARRSRDTWGH